VAVIAARLASRMLEHPTWAAKVPDRFDQLRDALSDRYRLERELGRGGMATVYLAHDLKHKRDVALKICVYLDSPPRLAHAARNGARSFSRPATENVAVLWDDPAPSAYSIVARW
jgi:hypothetical protein